MQDAVCCLDTMGQGKSAVIGESHLYGWGSYVRTGLKGENKKLGGLKAISVVRLTNGTCEPKDQGV